VDRSGAVSRNLTLRLRAKHSEVASCNAGLNTREEIPRVSLCRGEPAGDFPDNHRMTEAGQLSLVIASGDWFWRSVVSLAAHRCNRFNDVIGTEDGYMALAQIWERVAHGTTPDVCIVDARGDDPSLERLVTEIRADDVIRHMFIAAIGDESHAFIAADHISGSCVDPDELILRLERIANAAQALRQSSH
jgi:hypothetical protein